jgi:hypothetical protein
MLSWVKDNNSPLFWNITNSYHFQLLNFYIKDRKGEKVDAILEKLKKMKT